MSVITKVLTAALYRIGQADMLAKMQGKIHEAVLQATSVANQMLNTVMAYLRTAPQEIYLTQAEYDALPDTEQEMQPGDLYYKMDPTKAFNIEEEQEEGSGSEGGAA